MRRNVKLLVISLILVVLLGMSSMSTATSPQRFDVLFSQGYDTPFTVTNVIDCSEYDYSSEGSYYHWKITAEAPVIMECEFIFQTISIQNDDVLYTDESETPISLIVEDKNKSITPDGPIMPAFYNPGYTLEFTEPGDYIISTDHVGYTLNILLTVIEQQGSAIPSEVIATPSSSKVLINGSPVSFDAYTIDGNNYFKLRDMATVVSGTNKQFEVQWDNDKQAISLISFQPYTAVGGELVTGQSQSQNAVLNKAPIYIDGVEIKLAAYTIKGNNYFKLRDLAHAFNIGVTWDGTTKTIGIDTSMEYNEE